MRWKTTRREFILTLIAPALVYAEGLRGELEKQRKERRREERMAALEAGRGETEARVTRLERNQVRQMIEMSQLRGKRWEQERWRMPMPIPNDEEKQSA